DEITLRTSETDFFTSLLWSREFTQEWRWGSLLESRIRILATGPAKPAGTDSNIPELFHFLVKAEGKGGFPHPVPLSLMLHGRLQTDGTGTGKINVCADGERLPAIPWNFYSETNGTINLGWTSHLQGLLPGLEWIGNDRLPFSLDSVFNARLRLYPLELRASGVFTGKIRTDPNKDSADQPLMVKLNMSMAYNQQGRIEVDIQGESSLNNKEIMAIDIEFRKPVGKKEDFRIMLECPNLSRVGGIFEAIGGEFSCAIQGHWDNSSQAYAMSSRFSFRKCSLNLPFSMGKVEVNGTWEFAALVNWQDFLQINRLQGTLTVERTHDQDQTLVKLKSSLRKPARFNLQPNGYWILGNNQILEFYNQIDFSIQRRKEHVAAALLLNSLLRWENHNDLHHLSFLLTLRNRKNQNILSTNAQGSWKEQGTTRTITHVAANIDFNRRESEAWRFLLPSTLSPFPITWFRLNLSSRDTEDGRLEYYLNSSAQCETPKYPRLHFSWVTRGSWNNSQRTLKIREIEAAITTKNRPSETSEKTASQQLATLHVDNPIVFDFNSRGTPILKRGQWHVKTDHRLFPQAIPPLSAFDFTAKFLVVADDELQVEAEWQTAGQSVANIRGEIGWDLDQSLLVSRIDHAVCTPPFLRQWKLAATHTLELKGSLQRSPDSIQLQGQLINPVFPGMAQLGGTARIKLEASTGKNRSLRHLNGKAEADLLSLQNPEQTFRINSEIIRGIIRENLDGTKHYEAEFMVSGSCRGITLPRSLKELDPEHLASLRQLQFAFKGPVSYDMKSGMIAVRGESTLDLRDPDNEQHDVTLKIKGNGRFSQQLQLEELSLHEFALSPGQHLNLHYANKQLRFTALAGKFNALRDHKAGSICWQMELRSENSLGYWGDLQLITPANLTLACEGIQPTGQPLNALSLRKLTLSVADTRKNSDPFLTFNWQGICPLSTDYLLKQFATDNLELNATIPKSTFRWQQQDLPQVFGEARVTPAVLKNEQTGSRALQGRLDIGKQETIRFTGTLTPEGKGHLTGKLQEPLHFPAFLPIRLAPGRFELSWQTKPQQWQGHWQGQPLPEKNLPQGQQDETKLFLAMPKKLQWTLQQKKDLELRIDSWQLEGHLLAGNCYAQPLFWQLLGTTPL
ncbi:MAG: hypothetical protein D6820_10785, partial [Lentisphaerae bacterium]